MAINYVVKAQVVDLRADRPRSSDAYLVDTNVWFWTAYARVSLGSSRPQYYQTKEYPAYLRKITTAKATLHWCGLGLSELSHRIECTEHEIWNARQLARGGQECRPKEFRHNHSGERARVVTEIETAWKAVESLGSILSAPVIVDAANTTSALAELRINPLDGYDLFFLQTARTSGISQIISDDGDFCCLAGITLFTSNQTVINAATAQRKLVVR